MTIEEIERLIRQAEASAGMSFDHVIGSATLVLRKVAMSRIFERGDRSTSVAKGSAQDKAATIAAPFAGIFLTRHPWQRDNLVSPGVRVAKDAIVGLLKVGQCVRPVTANEDCVIDSQLAEDGALVGYGTPLYRLANQPTQASIAGWASR